MGITILTILAVPVCTLLGVLGAEIIKAKSKKFDAHTSSVQELEKKHQEDISKVRGEFNEGIAEVITKMNEIQKDQLRTNLTIEQLQKDVMKHTNVIERTYRLEQEVAVLKNRESVSEHRLEDLERA